MVPPLSNHRSYTDFHMSRRDWERLENIRDALRVSLVYQSLKSVCCSCCIGAISCAADILE